MKILITGATGFIGRHLVQALIQEGRDVRCLVRGTSTKGNFKNLDLELIYGDLLDKHSLKEAVKGINVIYHLGGEVYSPRVENYYNVNIQGTKNLLDACLDVAIERFIFFSSISAMGPNQNHKKPLEEEDPYNPISPYGISKYQCEQFISSFSQKFKLPVIIIRPPVVYGPGINNSSRVLSLLRMVRKGKIIIPGDGKQRISLCYIKNLIDGILLTEKKAHLILNKYILTDQRAYNYNEIIDTIAKEMKIKLSKFYVPQVVIQKSICFIQLFRRLLGLPPSVNLARLEEGTHSWECDISKAKKELGYHPKIEIEEGLKTTIQWCQENHLC